MESTTKVTIPKSLKNYKEKVYGLTVSQIKIYCINMLFTSAFIFLASLSKLELKIFFISLIIVQFALLFFFFRNETIAERNNNALNYYIKKWKGQTILAKFKPDLSKIRKYFPIEDISTNGKIRYKENRWGILYSITPADIIDVTDDGINSFYFAVMNWVNSFHGETIVKIIVIVRNKTDNRLKDIISSKINDVGISDAKRKHLYSIYDYDKQHSGTPSHKERYIFFGYGTYQNEADAEQGRLEKQPGFESLLRSTGIKAYNIIDENLIIWNLYKIIGGRRI